MIVALPGLLSPADAARMIDSVDAPDAHGPHPVTAEIQGRLEAALAGHPAFDIVAAPRRVGVAQALKLTTGADHPYPVDRIVAATDAVAALRLDVMVTLFLTAPERYGGGELIVTSEAGPQPVKLPAGDAMLYPGSSRRRVDPVADGVRWVIDIPVQSMIRDDEQRGILAEMWSVMDWLDHMPPEARTHTDPALTALERARADLIHMWADV